MRKIICHVTGRIKEIEDCKLIFDKEELAWCAGLFDGEGWIGTINKDRIRIEIKQNGTHVLDRFNKAIKAGRVVGPYKSSPKETSFLYRFTTENFEAIQFIMCQLWNKLSDIKRTQYKNAVLKYIKFRPLLKVIK